VASRQRASLIAQIRARREEIEAADRQAASERSDRPLAFARDDGVQDTASAGGLSALMAELDELREAERIVRRSSTIENVDDFVDRILAHARWTAGQRYFESEGGPDDA
jgi:hypothetical protein